MDNCPHGHPIRSSADRDRQGYCLECRRLGNRRYRSRAMAALELAMALESHGIPVTRSEPPVDRRQLAADIARRLASGES